MRFVLVVALLVAVAAMPVQAVPPDPCRPHCRADYIAGAMGVGAVTALGGSCDPEETGIAQVCVPIYDGDAAVEISVVDESIEVVGATYSYFDDQQIRILSGVVCGGPFEMSVPEDGAYLRVYLGLPLGSPCATASTVATQGHVAFEFS